MTRTPDPDLAPPLSRQTMLPDLFAQHPQTRAVLDGYGLSGCGGKSGPHESIEFFARAHGVDEPQLMAELAASVKQGTTDWPTVDLSGSNPGTPGTPGAPGGPGGPGVDDTIYRRFFTAAILSMLTVGGTWGAIILWRIGFSRSFTALSVHEINAHGHAQIFGWVGLFVMGFAYQAFPRLWHTRLAAPLLAAGVFVVMLAGLSAATIGTALAGRPYAAWLAATGGMLETLAILVFVGQIITSFMRSDARLEPYIGFVVAGLFWFAFQSAFSMWHTWNTMTAADRPHLLWYVATYQAPLRDVQVHGLAMLMILGVSQRMLPALFGVPAVGPRRAWTAIALLNLAVVGECVLFIAYRWTGNHVLAAMLLGPWIMLVIGAALIALPWRLGRPMPFTVAGDHSGDGTEIRDRSAKFVAAAFAWLAISLVMLLFLPVYMSLTHIPFSHAYYGAIRHAITVGFVSLMIMGFAAKVVPTLNGVDPARLSRLWGPFLLVNIGCFLRVSLQTLTDFHPTGFALVGVSGVLEVAGLAWWGIGLLAIMGRGKIEERRSVTSDPSNAPRPSFIAANHKVADVLAWYPATQPTFLNMGFKPLANPILRRTLARQVTIAQAAALTGTDLASMLENLNRVLAAAAAPRQVVELTVDGAAMRQGVR